MELIDQSHIIFI